MRELNILDCTLRDGGYVNNWNFSDNDIKGITKYLDKANIEFIELGYLSKIKEERGTIYNSFDKIKRIDIPLKKKIVMINYGEYPLEEIPKEDGSIFAIRVVFKKEQWRKALIYSKELIEKNYRVFLQPMQTIAYKDKELLDLIDETNKISAQALYIVDSFGEMTKEDLLRITSIYSHNLNKNIIMGFHSHNNFQLSFSLAIEFLKLNIVQKKIVDSSVYGMGRGAGNLNTELFTSYLNKNRHINYEIEYILKIMDLYIEKIYQKEKWGYNLGHFLSASLGCHPNYASYLLEKVNMSIEVIKDILERIPQEERSIFNKSLIESLYILHQREILSEITFSEEIDIKLQENILILAPGPSIIRDLDKIKKFIYTKKNLTIISLNHQNKYINSDFILFTNDKRYEEFKENCIKNEKIIISSNIKKDEYIDYIIDYELYSKNGKENLSSDILFNFIEKNKKIKKIYIAGMDGYYKNKENYIFETISTKNLDELNFKIASKIKSLKKETEFLTESIYNN